MVFKIIDGLNAVFQTSNLNSRSRPGLPKCCGTDKRVAKRYFYTMKSWLIRTASSRARVCSTDLPTDWRSYRIPVVGYEVERCSEQLGRRSGRCHFACPVRTYSRETSR